MKKLIIALGLSVAAATSAFAQSSALDVINQEQLISSQGTGVADSGASAYDFTRGRLGDGSPQFVASDIESGTNVDTTATGSIGSGTAYDTSRGRLGDGSPSWF
jgi:opacity protein-like surface antigen